MIILVQWKNQIGNKNKCYEKHSDRNQQYGHRRRRKKFAVLFASYGRFCPDREISPASDGGKPQGRVSKSNSGADCVGAAP